eukprot:345365-Prymnesium_polylepis.1
MAAVPVRVIEAAATIRALTSVRVADHLNALLLVRIELVAVGAPRANVEPCKALLVPPGFVAAAENFGWREPSLRSRARSAAEARAPRASSLQYVPKTVEMVCTTAHQEEMVPRMSAVLEMADRARAASAAVATSSPLLAAARRA